MSAWVQKKNKYGAVRQSYGGYHYDSKKEAEYAFKLDMLIKAGEIKGYKRQHRLSLDINGRHICDYYVDFRVENLDGTYEYHEVKGFATKEWLLKWKMAEALYPDNRFILIK